MAVVLPVFFPVDPRHSPPSAQTISHVFSFSTVIMAGMKRKSREGNKGKAAFKKKKNQSSSGGADGRRKRTGPRLPNAMLKELQLPKRYTDSDDDEIGSGDGDDVVVNNDLYEYEEGVAEEESKKNRRFDPVQNYQYELPDDFEVLDIYILSRFCFSRVKLYQRFKMYFFPNMSFLKNLEVLNIFIYQYFASRESNSINNIRCNFSIRLI